MIAFFIILVTALSTMTVRGDDETQEVTPITQQQEEETETATEISLRASEEDDLTHQCIELYPDDQDKEKTVTLQGLMPENAAAEVVDVTDQSTEENVLAAYDISISDGEKEYQPGEEHPISVEIADSRITEDSVFELWHIRDDGVREQITDFTVEEGKVCFDATGFSIYEIVSKEMTPPEETGWNRLEEGDIPGSAGSSWFRRIDHRTSGWVLFQEYSVQSRKWKNGH